MNLIMQVVYSGGSTPSPSPGLQRKTGYGRPIIPGYKTHVQPQILVQRSCEKLTEGDITLRDSIPAMSTGVACLCLLFNIALPGCGTLIAGLSVLCCSHVRPKGDSKGHCIWVNAGVALVQFILTFLFLLGWIWSIMWGVAFLSVSKQYHSKMKDRDDRQKSSGKDNTRSNMKNISKLNHDANDSRKGGTRHQKHNLNHNRYHQDQRESHTLEHQLHDGKQTFSPESPNSSDDVPKTKTNPDKDDKENIILSNSKFLSQNPSFYKSESNHIQRQPIMVLQQVPHDSLDDTSGTCLKTDPEDTIMKARTRNMKMMQRKISNNDLSPFVLTNKQLESIIIHDLPVRAPDRQQSTDLCGSSSVLPKH